MNSRLALRNFMLLWEVLLLLLLPNVVVAVESFLFECFLDKF